MNDNQERKGLRAQPITSSKPAPAYLAVIKAIATNNHVTEFAISPVDITLGVPAGTKNEDFRATLQALLDQQCIQANIQTPDEMVQASCNRTQSQLHSIYTENRQIREMLGSTLSHIVTLTITEDDFAKLQQFAKQQQSAIHKS